VKLKDIFDDRMLEKACNVREEKEMQNDRTTMIAYCRCMGSVLS